MIPRPNESRGLVEKFKERLDISTLHAIGRIFIVFLLVFIFFLVTFVIMPFVILKCHEVLIFWHYVLFAGHIFLICFGIYKVQIKKRKSVWWRFKLCWRQ